MTDDPQSDQPTAADHLRDGYNKLLQGKHHADRFGSQVTSSINDISTAYNTVSRLFAQCRDIWRAVTGKK